MKHAIGLSRGRQFFLVGTGAQQMAVMLDQEGDVNGRAVLTDPAVLDVGGEMLDVDGRDVPQRGGRFIDRSLHRVLPALLTAGDDFDYFDYGHRILSLRLWHNCQPWRSCFWPLPFSTEYFVHIACQQSIAPTAMELAFPYVFHVLVSAEHAGKNERAQIDTVGCADSHA